MEEGEISSNSVVKYFFTTAADGKKYKTAFYSLECYLSCWFSRSDLRAVRNSAAGLILH